LKASEKIREKNYSSFISFVSEFELLFLIPKIKDGLFKLKMQGRNVKQVAWALARGNNYVSMSCLTG